MAFNFEAQPKVVHSKAKYRNIDQQSAQNEDGSAYATFMRDNRIRQLTPAQQEEEYVRIEKERIKLQNMHEQLTIFKKNKKRVSPYEIKPSPNPRIDVNLTFFLTDANNVPPPQTTVDTQTDKFQELPPSPKYVPKKTGRDVSTQVEDGELFLFDREVLPIVDVITTKTLEQAMLEIEEEEEISKIQQYKKEYAERRQKEDKAWRAVVQKEVDIITKKNKLLEEARKREKAKIELLHRVQAYNIAKTYLSRISFNSLEFLYNNGYYHNTEREALNVRVPEFLVDNLKEEYSLKEQIDEQVNVLFDFLPELYASLRKPADEQYQKKAAKRQSRRVNYENKLKRVRILYRHDDTPATFVAKYIQKFFEGALEEYLNGMKARLREIQEKLLGDEMTQEEADNVRISEFPELGPQSYFRLQVNDVPKLFFTVAQNMYYETLTKNWKLDISATVFNRNGDKIYTTNKANPRPDSKSMKYYPNIRDKKLKVCDDIGLKINVSKLEPEAQHIIITVDIKDLNGFITNAAEFTDARVRVSDFHTDQTFNEAKLMQEFPYENLKDPNLEEEVKQSSTLICYYLYRSSDFGWMLESVRLARNTSGENGLSSLETSLAQLIRQANAESEEPTSPIESPQDEDKSPDEPVDPKKKQQDKGKTTKEESKQKDSKEPPKGQDKGGDKGGVKKKEEEKEIPKIEEKPKLVTRTFGPVELIYFEPVEVVQEKVIEAIKNEQPALLDTFEFGFEILIEDKLHVRPTQLKRITDIGSFEIKAKPRPPEEPKLDDDDGADDDNADGSNVDQDDDGND